MSVSMRERVWDEDDSDEEASSDEEEKVRGKKEKEKGLPLSESLESDWRIEDGAVDHEFSKLINRNYGNNSDPEEHNRRGADLVAKKREKEKKKHRKKFIKERQESSGLVVIRKSTSTPKLFITEEGELSADLNQVQFAERFEEACRPSSPLTSGLFTHLLKIWMKGYKNLFIEN